MNTDNTTPQSTGLNQPAMPTPTVAPGPEMNVPVENKMKLSTMRIVVILLAVLVMAGGAAFLAFKSKSQPETNNEALVSPMPSVTTSPSGLKMAVSDDPEVLEKELNDINVDNVDDGIDSVNKDVNSL